MKTQETKRCATFVLARLARRTDQPIAIAMFSVVDLACYVQSQIQPRQKRKRNKDYIGRRPICSSEQICDKNPHSIVQSPLVQSGRCEHFFLPFFIFYFTDLLLIVYLFTRFCLFFVFVLFVLLAASGYRNTSTLILQWLYPPRSKF